MATQIVTCDLSYGAYGNGTTYSAARGTMDASETGSTFVGQIRVSSSNYLVYRSFLRFPTSEIPAGATVTSVKLRMVARSDESGTDFNVYIVGGGATPPAESDWDAALTSSPTYTWRNTSGLTTNTQYESEVLSNSINLSGSTYYTLLSSRDRAGTTPGGSEYISIGVYNAGTAAYRPALIVEYTLPSNLPIIWWS